MVFLKVSPLKGIQHFGVRGKLAPRFVGPFEIVQKTRSVAYKIALPPNLEGVHDVFHVSNLRRYVHDPSHIIDMENLEVEPNLTFSEQPVRILDLSTKQLRNKVVPLVKIL